MNVTITPTSELPPLTTVPTLPTLPADGNDIIPDAESDGGNEGLEAAEEIEGFSEIHYGTPKSDEYYSYRMVAIPEWLAEQIHINRCLDEDEWRALGIQMSRGWCHYGVVQPDVVRTETHIIPIMSLKMKKPLGIHRYTGEIPQHWWAPIDHKDLLEGYMYESYQDLP